MTRTVLTFVAAVCLAAAPMVAQEAGVLEPTPTQEVETLPLSAPVGASESITGTVLELGTDHMVVQTPTGNRLVELGEARVPAGLRQGDGVVVDYRVETGGVVVIEEIRPFGGQVARAEVETTGESQTIAAVETTAEPQTFAATSTTGERLTLTGTVVEVTDTELVVRTETGLQRFRIEDVQVPVGLQVGDRVTVAYVRSPDQVMIVEDVRIVTLDQVAALPATGSSLPRVALFGLLALLGAVALRVWRTA